MLVARFAAVLIASINMAPTESPKSVTRLPSRSASIGQLARFPPEIREILYEHCAKAWSPSLLGANNQIYQEMISYLREKMALHLTTDPADTEPRIPFFNVLDGQRRFIRVR